MVQKYFQGFIHCRPDCIFISNTLQDLVTTTEIPILILTDHSPVLFPVSKGNEFLSGKGSWKLNNSLTKDQNYIIKNEKLVCRFILETSPFSAVNQKENSKKYFKNLQKFTINYTNHIAKEKRQQRINLENQLKILEKCLNEDDNLNKHNAINPLTLFRMGFLGAADGYGGGGKNVPPP